MRIIKNIMIIGLPILLLLFSIFPASAMTTSSANVGTTLIVSNVPTGVDVHFILNNGIPVFTKADSNGTARYLPLVGGTLRINVIQNGNLIDTMTLEVVPPTPTPPTPTPPPGGRGSGTSVGGSGVISREPFSNIAQYEAHDNNLIAGTPVTYSFTNPGIAIYQLVVTGTQDENQITMRVESLNGTSTLAGGPAPGNIFSNINIWSGSNNIGSILVRFKVENSWMNDNNIKSSDINLNRWDQSKWISLDTTVINNDDKYTYFEANTTGLPTFAISTEKGAAPSEAGQTPSSIVSTPEITNTAMPTPTTTKTSGFEIVLAIIGIFAIYIARKVR